MTPKEDIRRWHWSCNNYNCGFVHISECNQAQIDEVLAVKALCPICKSELRPPLEQAPLTDYEG